MDNVGKFLYIEEFYLANTKEMVEFYQHNFAILIEIMDLGNHQWMPKSKLKGDNQIDNCCQRIFFFFFWC
jgi:hypothetical protein